MPYYRLIEETDIEIYVTPKGMEIPGTECIHVTGDLSFFPSSQHWTVTFEDERTFKVDFTGARFEKFKTIYTLQKCTTDS